MGAAPIELRSMWIMWIMGRYMGLGQMIKFRSMWIMWIMGRHIGAAPDDRGQIHMDSGPVKRAAPEELQQRTCRGGVEEVWQRRCGKGGWRVRKNRQ